MAERVENNRASRRIVPKQDLLLELTENLNILSGVGRESVFFQLTVILIISQVQKQLKSFSLNYLLHKEDFIQELCGVVIL